jgi:hypothetical protein
MSGGPPKEALAILIPRFEKLTGHDVKMTYAVIAALCSKNSRPVRHPTWSFCRRLSLRI